METTSRQSSQWERTTTQELLRWCFSWGIIPRLLVCCAGVAALIVLFYAVEDWRGWHAWEKFKRQWEAKGEHFDLAHIVPKPVPPEQNFAATPLFKPLFDYTLSTDNTPITWHDLEGIKRTEAVSISLPRSPRAEETTAPTGETRRSNKAPELDTWAEGDRADLRAWQEFFSDNANYPAPAQPGLPAEDVLAALSKFDAEMAELRIAAARPYSVFPIHYEEDATTLLRHLTSLKRLCQVLTLRALALLELGRTDEALREVLLALRVGDSIQSEPILISQLARLGIVQIALQPVWQGLADGRWNEAQLATLQARLADARVLESYALSLRGENVSLIGQIMDHLREGRYSLENIRSGAGDPVHAGLFAIRAIPDGWFYQNQLLCGRVLFEQALPMVDVQRRCLNLEKVRAAEETLNRIFAKRTPYNFVARMLLPSYAGAARRFAYGESCMQLAKTACALERFRLTQGQYPETLDMLVPQFLATLPHDVIGGQPLHYRRTSDGRFVLYSVGLNQTDDGGEPAAAERNAILETSRTSPVNVKKGDWVWWYPAK